MTLPGSASAKASTEDGALSERDYRVIAECAP
jgi:hypothetical protein